MTTSSGLRENTRATLTSTNLEIALTTVNIDPFGHRNRSDSITGTSSYRIFEQTFSNNVLVTNRDLVYPITYVAQQRSMFDKVTPGYARRVADGDIINNPMDSTFISREGDDTGIAIKSTSGSSWYSVDVSRGTGSIWGFPEPALSTVNLKNLKTLVSTKALSKVNNSGFMGIVSMAEFGKTLSMLRNPLASATGMLRYIAQLRAGRKNILINQLGNGYVTINGRKYLKYNRVLGHRGPGKEVRPPKGNIIVPAGTAISGSLLANNLGLRPLMMDLDALLNGIPNLHKEERQSYRASQEIRETIVSHSTQGGWGMGSVAVTDTSTVITTCRASILAADRFSITSDFGISPLDIPSAAWELIPYSFVLDYFVNVGDFIGTLKTVNGRDVLASTVVTTVDSTVQRTFGATSPPPGYTLVRGCTGSYTCRSIVKKREVGLDYIGLAYQPRPFGQATVIQNLLSLTVQALVGMNPRKSGFY